MTSVESENNVETISRPRWQKAAFWTFLLIVIMMFGSALSDLMDFLIPIAIVGLWAWSGREKRGELLVKLSPWIWGLNALSGVLLLVMNLSNMALPPQAKEYFTFEFIWVAVVSLALCVGLIRRKSWLLPLFWINLAFAVGMEIWHFLEPGTETSKSMFLFVFSIFAMIFSQTLWGLSLPKKA